MLDEPASGLGSAQRTRLAEILVELGSETTIVLVEHDLQMVAQISSEVFVLIDGQLRFTGDAEELLALRGRPYGADGSDRGGGGLQVRLTFLRPDDRNLGRGAFDGLPLPSCSSGATPLCLRVNSSVPGPVPPSARRR